MEKTPDREETICHTEGEGRGKGECGVADDDSSLTTRLRDDHHEDNENNENNEIENEIDNDHHEDNNNNRNDKDKVVSTPVCIIDNENE